jgi:hypothetical protein
LSRVLTAFELPPKIRQLFISWGHRTLPISCQAHHVDRVRDLVPSNSSVASHFDCLDHGYGSGMNYLAGSKILVKRQERLKIRHQR